MPVRATSLRNLSLLLRPRTSPRSISTSTSNPHTSVSPSELSHFSALVSSWWEPHGSSRLLHLMNPLRHDFITSCLSTSPPESQTRRKLRYLDIGCGGGIFAESAARLPSTASVLAIDPSPEVIDIARTHACQDPVLLEPGRLEYRHTSIEELALPKGPEEQFDVLSLFEVLEHIERPSPFLSKCLQFVKPGGWLVLSTIARTWTSWVTTKVVAEDLLRIVPRGTHDWGQYVNERELRAWFGKQEGWGSEGGVRAMGVVYVPGLGWRMVDGGEKWGNYFFGVRKDEQ